MNKQREDKFEYVDYNSAIDGIASATGTFNLVSNQIVGLNDLKVKPSLDYSVEASLNEMNTICRLSANLPRIETIDNQSEILENSRVATAAMSGLANLDTLKSLSGFVSPHIGNWFNNTNSLLENQIAVMGKTSEDLFPTVDENYSSYVLGVNIAKNSEILLHAENSVSNLNWDTLGVQSSIKSTDFEPIKSSMLELSMGTAEFNSPFIENPTLYTSLDPYLSKIASQEYFSATNLIESLSVTETKNNKEEVIKSDIIYENEIKLSEYLPKVGKDLYDLWRGAIESFKGDNPDKIRHFTVSIRELFTQILHTLAPDDDIKKWSSKPEYYDKDKPTRRARLNYICRNVSHPPFGKFLNKDINATLSFIDLFQKGTHSVKSGFSDDQLVAFRSKAETSLKFLLEIEYRTNN